jgi:hypothetical protein
VAYVFRGDGDDPARSREAGQALKRLLSEVVREAARGLS